ncbi:1,6-anhydro-N-acetylmuramyl-L-alanine amidase AmpD [Methylobacillus arboreus]|uniref:1,6-anhydro-N-acetylmuramyl-L-alanine amidase AmpD n=1 Tax=Methylobacillus arboreus TaxID=755170 RepID=UPI001E288D65|nr:1,6-anhydro-N-acetylmuramyl-L-alanine amidase AmpD [Methylobacillus arboreus]MCB5190241.1 1,6-anhydro-N-acetylmuramyl-L-alanine amidase AmpD [Methylobacillus arboreus]
MDQALSIDQQGLVAEAEFIASPNFDARPAGSEICLIVIHNISLPPGKYGGPGISELFTNRLNPHAHPYYAEIHQLRVSSHFVIRRDGALQQFVPCEARAWHAGVSSWQGRERCNDFSIGIELEGSDFEPFATAQYTVLQALLKLLVSHYPIRDIVGHSDIAPGRKTDPGPHFNWKMLAGLKLDMAKNG